MTSSQSTNPSSLDRQNLLLNSKFLRPKMMSCSFERLKFLEYYQEKKVILLSFSPPSRCPEKDTVSQSSLGSTACRKTLLLTSYFLHILKPWKLQSPKRSLMAVSSPGHNHAKIIHPCNLKGSKIKARSLCLGLKQLSSFS